MIASPQFIVNDPAQLADYVASMGRGLVAFDGRPAAGKTYLAKMLARRLGLQALDGDDFLLGNRQPFMDQLDFDKLAAAIDTGLSASPIVLLSSAFTRAVVERAKRSPVAVVWVEGVSEETLTAARENYADDMFANAACIGGIRRPPLLSQVEEYIAFFRARLTADRVYLNAFG